MPQPNAQPGTVSKILWHFTGGPKWNSKTERQSSSRKPANAAYKAFCGILRSKELRLGGYAEIARVLIPERRRYDLAKKDFVIEKDVTVAVRSSPVCCLADIPIAHLRYHENRYGRFAIGFHREAAVRRGFNPVLYTLEHTHVIRSLYSGIIGLESVDCLSAHNAAAEVSNYWGDCEHDDIDDLRMWGSEAVDYIEMIEGSINDANKSFAKLLAFIKTFTQEEFASIYCEREWRALKPFAFTYDDLAMLILPQSVGTCRYYDEFIRDQIRKLNLPRRVPIVPWEDLIEH